MSAEKTETETESTTENYTETEADKKNGVTEK